jgi:hypothetical protein
MKITKILPKSNWVLTIISDDGRIGDFDVSSFLGYEIFEPLKDHSEFLKVSNGGYFIQWDCGADLSVDTIEARWQIVDAVKSLLVSAK